MLMYSRTQTVVHLIQNTQQFSILPVLFLDSTSFHAFFDCLTLCADSMHVAQNIKKVLFGFLQLAKTHNRKL